MNVYQLLARPLLYNFWQDLPALGGKDYAGAALFETILQASMIETQLVISAKGSTKNWFLLHITLKNVYKYIAACKQRPHPAHYPPKLYEILKI